jgi:UDP-GlcNAc:undecaprenyl-phosphate GlcNAc-1-phosphate transferase
LRRVEIFFFNHPAMIVQGLLVASALASAGATAAACAFARKMGRALHLTSRPDGIRRLHEGETPLIGGIAVLVPVLAGSLVFAFGGAGEQWMVIVVLTTAAMMVLGFFDDVLDLASGWRFAAITFVIFCAFSLEPSFVLHTLRFQYWRMDLNVPLDPLAAPVTAVIILGFMNAVNMADGMNGQLLGSVIFWSLFIVRRMGVPEGMPYVLLASAAAVALSFNLRGKLFSGSVGAYGLSAFIALGAIAAYHNTHAPMHAVTPVCLF